MLQLERPADLFARRANRSTADWRATIERHKVLYEAILAGDASLAEQCIARHYAAADIASLEVAGKSKRETARK